MFVVVFRGKVYEIIIIKCFRKMCVGRWGERSRRERGRECR